MKKGLLGKIMAIIGGLVAAYSGHTWYTIAAGIWEPLNKKGEPVGPAAHIVLTIVFLAVMAVGIYLWVRSNKEKKA